MARKTLNQILKQNTFTGADVGKAEVLNAVSYLKGGKYAIGEKELSIMRASLQTYSQRLVHKSYKDFLIYLDTFYNMIQGYGQQFWHGIEHLMLLLSAARYSQSKYITYLEQPLVITAAEYKTYREKAEAELYKPKYSLQELNSLLIVAAIRAYQKKKELAPELAALKDVMAKYEKEPAEVKRYDTFASLDDKTVINTYAKFHNVHKDMETLIPFVLNRWNTDFDGEKLLEPEQISQDAKDIISELETISGSSDYSEKRINALLAFLIRVEIQATIRKNTDANLKINFYEGTEPPRAVKELAAKREEFKNVFEAFLLEVKEKTNRLEKLLEDIGGGELTDGFKPIGLEAELLIKDWNEAKKDYPEANAALEGIGKKLTKDSKTGKYSIKELAALGLDLSELIDLPDSIACMAASRSSKPTPKNLITKTKAIRGGIVIAPEGKKPPEIPSWVLDFDILSSPFERKYLPEAEQRPILIDKENVAAHIKTLIEPSLKGLNGINAILDTYGNLLKVDLSPIKADLKKITQQIGAYNNVVYILSMNMEDTLIPDSKNEYAIIAKYKQTIKDTFPIINPEDYKLDPEKVKKMEAYLETLPIDKIMNNRYFEPFLTGGGIIIEQENN